MQENKTKTWTNDEKRKEQQQNPSNLKAGNDDDKGDEVGEERDTGEGIYEADDAIGGVDVLK